MSVYEAGLNGGLIDTAADVASDLLGAEATQQAVNQSISAALASPEVRRALRPLYLEAGIYAVCAFAVGGLLWSLFRRV